MKPARALGVAFLILAGTAGTAAAKPWWLRGTDSNDADFLPPDVAFRVGATVDDAAMHVRWVIADGYYLYRSRIEIKGESPGLIVERVDLPAGTPKADPYLGNQQIYEQQLDAPVHFMRTDAGAHPLAIKVTYQGCAEAGLCYPPITKVLFPYAAARGTTAGAAASLPVSGWVRAAILAGGFAFLAAGIVLRKGRKLEPPPA